MMTGPIVEVSSVVAVLRHALDYCGSNMKDSYTTLILQSLKGQRSCFNIFCCKTGIFAVLPVEKNERAHTHAHTRKIETFLCAEGYTRCSIDFFSLTLYSLNCCKQFGFCKLE